MESKVDERARAGVGLCRHLKSSLLGEFDLIDSPELYVDRHENKDVLAYTEIHELSHKDLVHLTCVGNLQNVLAVILNQRTAPLDGVAMNRRAVGDMLNLLLDSSRLTHEGWATFRERFLYWLYPTRPEPPGIGEPYISALGYFERATSSVPAQYGVMRFTQAGLLARAAMNSPILRDFASLEDLSLEKLTRHLGEEGNFPDSRLRILSEAMEEIEWSPKLVSKLRRAWRDRAPESLRSEFDGDMRPILQAYFSTSSYHKWSQWLAIERELARVLHAELVSACEDLPMLAPQGAIGVVKRWRKDVSRYAAKHSLDGAFDAVQQSSWKVRVVHEAVNYPISTHFVDLIFDYNEMKVKGILDHLVGCPFAFQALSLSIPNALVLAPLAPVPLPPASGGRMSGRIFASSKEYMLALQVLGVTRTPTALPTLSDSFAQPLLAVHRFAELKKMILGDNVESATETAWVCTSERLHLASIQHADRSNVIASLSQKLACLAFAPPVLDDVPPPEHLELTRLAGVDYVTYILGTHRTDFAIRVLLGGWCEAAYAGALCVGRRGLVGSGVGRSGRVGAGRGGSDW